MMVGDFPVAERPRERLLTRGGDALSDTELLATLLGTGIRGSSAMDVAREVLASYGDVSAVARADVGELARIRGVGPARACALAAAMELGRRAQAPRRERFTVRVSADIYRYYAPRLTHLTHEVFHVMSLDAKHRLLRDTRVVEGGLTSVSVLPREVYAPALRERAVAVALVHNHPSGDPAPSDDDHSLAQRLRQAGYLLGINAVDFVIVGEGRYSSMVELGKYPRE